MWVASPSTLHPAAPRQTWQNMFISPAPHCLQDIEIVQADVTKKDSLINSLKGVDAVSLPAQVCTRLP